MAMKSDAYRPPGKPGTVKPGLGDWGVGPKPTAGQAQADAQWREDVYGISYTDPAEAAALAAQKKTDARNSTALKFKATEPDNIDKLMKHVFFALSRRSRATSFLTGGTAYANQGSPASVLGF